jgi:hypothetical protein
MVYSAKIEARNSLCSSRGVEIHSSCIFRFLFIQILDFILYSQIIIHCFLLFILIFFIIVLFILFYIILILPCISIWSSKSLLFLILIFIIVLIILPNVYILLIIYNIIFLNYFEILSLRTLVF